MKYTWNSKVNSGSLGIQIYNAAAKCREGTWFPPWWLVSASTWMQISASLVVIAPWSLRSFWSFHFRKLENISCCGSKKSLPVSSSIFQYLSVTSAIVSYCLRGISCIFPTFISGLMIIDPMTWTMFEKGCFKQLIRLFELFEKGMYSTKTYG